MWDMYNRTTSQREKIRLDSSNTIKLGIHGLLPPQAVALSSCRQFQIIQEASNRMLRTKVTGLDFLITAPMSKEKADQANQDMRSDEGGANKQHGLKVIGTGKGKASDIKVHNLSTNNNQLPFQQAKEEIKREIASAYEIPPTLAGDLTAATLNNIENHREVFFEGTVVTQWRKITADLTIGMVRLGFIDADVCVGFNHGSLSGGDLPRQVIVSNIPNLLRLYSENELREKLGDDPRDGGDEIDPIEQDDTDQEALDERINSYLERKTHTTEVMEKELYRLCEMYDLDMEVSRAS